ncbi:MAG: FAD-dependent oxidoreductase [Chloroherpetonaceae bacterium]|nr:FAD-dependent oxidoreductase [Chloroherpetonaceae bacterium]
MAKKIATTCLIIGAGICGLIAADMLHRAGVKAIVLDKSRGVGGRLATRRIQSGTFDHGAQYFTVRDPKFYAIVEEWLAAGIVREWTRHFHTAAGPCDSDAEPRYYGIGGMTAIAKHIARHLEVHLNETVSKFYPNHKAWHIETTDGKLYQAESLILTPPVPQSLELVRKSGISIPIREKRMLEAVTYLPCLGVLALLEQESKVPHPGGLWLYDDAVLWLGDNQKKGVSQVPAVTIHATPAFSRTYWDADDAAISKALIEHASKWLGAKVLYAEVKRWRYSAPDSFVPEPFIALNAPLPLIFAGDAFVSPCVEGAVLSGMAAAEYLLRQDVSVAES